MKVFADTNTLYPYYVCDLLLHCAEEDIFSVLWTENLLAELLDVGRVKIASGPIVRRHRQVAYSRWEAHYRREMDDSAGAAGTPRPSSGRAMAQYMGHSDPTVTLRESGHLFDGVEEQLTEQLDQLCATTVATPSGHRRPARR
jgi:hypothetical protein